MRNRHKNKSKQVKVTFIAEGEELPKGYVAVAGLMFRGVQMQAAIPEKLLKDPEKAKILIDQAQAELFMLLGQGGFDG